MKEFTEFKDGWVIKSNRRFSHYPMYGTHLTSVLDLRHFPCYKNTWIVHCVSSKDEIRCAVCDSKLVITQDEFDALIFST